MRDGFINFFPILLVCIFRGVPDTDQLARAHVVDPVVYAAEYEIIGQLSVLLKLFRVYMLGKLYPAKFYSAGILLLSLIELAEKFLRVIQAVRVALFILLCGL